MDERRTEGQALSLLSRVFLSVRTKEQKNARKKERKIPENGKRKKKEERKYERIIGKEKECNSISFACRQIRACLIIACVVSELFALSSSEDDRRGRIKTALLRVEFKRKPTRFRVTQAMHNLSRKQGLSFFSFFCVIIVECQPLKNC